MCLAVDGLDDAQRAVLDPQAPVVLEEHDAVAGGKFPWSALDLDCNIRAQFARSLQLATREAR